MINEQIHRLFEKNRAIFAGLPISFDGVVDETCYLKSPIHTALLLKDINGDERKTVNGKKVIERMSSDWEYMSDLYKQVIDDNETLYKTWPNACLWLELLYHGDCSYSECMNERGEFDSTRLRKNLLAVSIVNIKKTPGGGSSIYDEIKAAAESPDNQTMLKEQINIIDPQLIICGGTFELAKIITNADKKAIETLPSGAEYFIDHERIYLEFVHPMWFSVSRKILFAYAKQVFREVRSVLKNQNTPQII